MISLLFQPLLPRHTSMLDGRLGATAVCTHKGHHVPVGQKHLRAAWLQSRMRRD